jgi:hypothetical protein
MMNIIRVAITVILPMGISLAQQTAAPKPASTGAGSGDSASLVKTNSQKYKGTLVDAVCATSPGSQSSADRAALSTAPAEPRASQRDASQKEGTSRQSNAAESCAATAGTTDFALRLSDGRTLRFDSVGSERVKEGLKTKKKWVDAAATRKPIRSTVHGVETGDTLMALSID